MDEVRIAGGGVAGLAAAVLLAREGLRVEVFDRRGGDGGRFAGGWQVIENGSQGRDALAELAALGLGGGLEVIPAHRALFLDGRGGRHEVSSREPYAYFIRRGGRGSLDAFLREQALAAGARIRTGEAAPAEVDLVATGPRQSDGAAREVVFRSDLPDTVAVLFDPQLTPSGYAYLFCLGGHATFGVAQVRRTARLREAHEQAWRRFEEAFGRFRVEDANEGGQYMSFALPSGLLAPDGRWHAGEAAGVQDFLFGLGNRLALRSAALAVEGLLGRWDRPSFERGVLRPMRTSIGLRALYEASGRRGLAGFCRAAAGGDFRRFLLRLQSPNPATATLARLAMALWREPRGCRHGPLCTWCRRREI